MKTKYLIPLVVALVVAAGYGIFSYVQTSSQYRLTLKNELRSSDFHTPGGVAQTAETYTDGQGYYHVYVMRFADTAAVDKGVAQLEETYNPAKIILDKKYVGYKELSPGYHFYFYPSGKYLITVEYSGTKDIGDMFVMWFYSHYGNK